MSGLGGAGGGGFGLQGGAAGAVQHLAQIMGQPLGRLMARSKAGGFVGQLGQLGLDLAQRLGGGIGGLGGGVQTVVMALTGLFQLALFPDQPLDHLAGVAVQGGFTFDIAVQLGNARQKRLDRLRGAGLGLVQRLAFDSGAGQDRGGDLLFLAQRRQMRIGGLAGGNGAAGSGLGIVGGADRLAQRLGRRHARGIRLGPAAIQKQTLGLTQGGADLAIAGGGAGLTGKACGLRRKLVQRVIDAGQVRLGGIQLQFGLVAALVKTGNPRRLFQNPAARLGLGVDQLRYLPLPHQRRRMRPGRGVRKQHLHVAGTHFLAVDAIGAAGIAGDAAGDVQ